jgi:DNA invertase Pin-like site-specific DNA recombinase
MKVAIYARVSKEDQELEHQLKALQTFAFQQNYDIFQVYIDKVSGTKDSRPELNRLMFDARAKCFGVVLVWKIDRLGRSLQHLLRITDEWQKRGIDFISITQGFDTTTASGKLIFQVLGAIAEFEHTLISERTKLGIAGKENVGKRGKDKRPRNRSGYYLRYQKKDGVAFNEF